MAGRTLALLDQAQQGGQPESRRPADFHDRQASLVSELVERSRARPRTSAASRTASSLSCAGPGDADLHHAARWSSRDRLLLARTGAEASGAAIHDAQGRFRKLRGYRDLAALIRALDRTAMDSRKEVA